MNATNRLQPAGLYGDGVFRSVTLALSVDKVRGFLPPGAELGPQAVTEPGTHPVICSFNRLTRVRTSLPSLLPTLDYSEYTFGIPYTYATRGQMSRQSPGPYYFMPRLYLDSFFAVMGGIAFWGYRKQSANFAESDDTCSITSPTGDGLTALRWTSAGPFEPVDAHRHFAPIRRMLDQPLLSFLPASIGPFPVIAPFDKQWSAARLKPIKTSMEVDSEFIDGFEPGLYPANGRSPGIDASVLGSYEYQAPWALGVPYSPFIWG